MKTVAVLRASVIRQGKTGPGHSVQWQFYCGPFGLDLLPGSLANFWSLILTHYFAFAREFLLQPVLPELA